MCTRRRDRCLLRLRRPPRPGSTSPPAVPAPCVQVFVRATHTAPLPPRTTPLPPMNWIGGSAAVARDKAVHKRLYDGEAARGEKKRLTSIGSAHFKLPRVLCCCCCLCQQSRRRSASHRPFGPQQRIRIRAPSATSREGTCDTNRANNDAAQALKDRVSEPQERQTRRSSCSATVVCAIARRPSPALPAGTAAGVTAVASRLRTETIRVGQHGIK